MELQTQTNKSPNKRGMNKRTKQEPINNIRRIVQHIIQTPKKLCTRNIKGELRLLEVCDEISKSIIKPKFT